ncbi:efflux RND transporter permease subunit [Peribacillus acanthi]|uniref:efflux RND transporter permease subunit n=1 Tax=Peribacillus acanthi TaxID=2171554 RepID=UPI000D3E5037|nr:efflux RND transporter permease subunit [Peribacillus acanthi]
MKISAFSIRRPVFTLVTMVLLLVLGAVSLLNIPVKLIPEIKPPVGVVVTTYEGASPIEVNEKITKPLEANLSTLPGLKTITSTSQEGANFTLLQFSWTTDIDEVQSDVLQRIDGTPLPDDVEKPRFLKFDPAQFPIIQLSLRSESNPKALRSLATDLQKELTKVEGVASVTISGSLTEQIRINLNQDKLKTYGLSQSDLVAVIRSNNVSMPGDPVLTDGKQLTTRIISSISSIEAVKNLVVTVNPINGNKVTIKDVALVELVNTSDGTMTRTNETPSVLISVLQQSDSNTATVSKAFQLKLKELLEKDKYKDIESDVLFDQGDYIKRAIGNISTSLVLGGALAMVVLFLFLQNVKSPIIIGIAIPYSVIVTFVLMFFSDFTLNIMTLGGLALGIGMLVDNSIVVIENIYRHLSMGKNPKTAAADGAREVGGAITASTLTTVAVFLPVVFVSGIIGDLFTEFALTISFSLVASLYVALTVVPMLASRWLRGGNDRVEEKRKHSSFMKGLDRSIRWSLHNRVKVLLITVLFLVMGGFGLTTVGTQFLPSTDEGYFSIKIKLENGAAISETDKVVSALESQLKNQEDVDVYVGLIGTTQEESFRGTTKANTAEVYVKLKPLEKRDKSVFQFVDDVKANLEKAALDANPTTELKFILQSTTGSEQYTLTFNVKDTDPIRLKETVKRISSSLKEIKGVSDLSTDLNETVEEIQIQVNRDKALQAGMPPARIAMLVNDATRGVTAAQIVDENANVYSILVEYDQNITQNINKLKTLSIKKPNGTFTTLGELASFTIGKSPLKIQRINQQDAIQFTLKYKAKTNLGDISDAVDKKIKQLKLPDETEIVFSGDRELLDSSMNDLFLALSLAILFIYLVMAAQFESLKYPFVIMFSVPLIIIGVSIALTITRTPIGLTAIIGVIVLAGIVVNNAIVIVEYINQRKGMGMVTFEAIVASVLDRVRPILMTALTTILGLIPLALGIGEGAEINQPMGITVIGGLISSTFLTLFIIPIIYSYFDKETRKSKKRFKRANQKVLINEERELEDLFRLLKK